MSDMVDAQAGLSLHLAHWFCHAVAQLYFDSVHFTFTEREREREREKGIKAVYMYTQLSIPERQ